MKKLKIILKRRLKMFMLLIKDEWSQYAIVNNHLGRVKLFSKREEAFDYATEFELCPFQVIAVTI
jgi:hypothetical protein